MDYLFCLLFMKLKIPDGLEKFEMNEKLSPTIGQPKLPGISSISFGEAHVFFSKMKVESTKIDRSTKASKMLNSIATH